MKFEELEKLLKKDGWYYVSTRGSHFYYQHPTKEGKVAVPNHSGDIPKGTANSLANSERMICYVICLSCLFL